MTRWTRNHKRILYGFGIEGFVCCVRLSAVSLSESYKAGLLSNLVLNLDLCTVWLIQEKASQKEPAGNNPYHVSNTYLQLDI
jgi:hypothetical protein